LWQPLHVCPGGLGIDETEDEAAFARAVGEGDVEAIDDRERAEGCLSEVEPAVTGARPGGEDPR